MLALSAGLAVAAAGQFRAARAADDSPKQPPPATPAGSSNGQEAGNSMTEGAAGGVGNKEEPAGGAGGSSKFSSAPLSGEQLPGEAAKQLAAEEEEKKQQRKRRRGRIRELEEIRAELAEKELELLQKGAALQAKEQTLTVLREEIGLEKRLRTLLTKEKEKAEEQAALAMGLCVGGSMLP